ncbi:MAG: hypothetical protein AUJ75_01290 [Candidatus Omnitrophica bacterium CG1_02_49_10]|nr:MAG: hypothetical protein AUJ75_01290 [Candidatus Omnitrophica bacterium CG1_02_49_10]
MKKINLIIFDLDGTIIDSSQDIVNGINHMLDALGFQGKRHDEIIPYVGYGVEYLVESCLPKGRMELLRDGIEVFVSHNISHLFDNTKLFPGIAEILPYFDSKRKVILTNRQKDITEKLLEGFGISKYFDAVLGGDDEKCRKPSTCPIDNLLADFKETKDVAIMVGDTEVDIKTGKDAGISTCAVSYGMGKMDELERAGADYIIDHISRLKDIVY